MRLYQAFDVNEETPVQWLAVHPLRWRREWGEPAIMFREVDDKTQAMNDAAPAMLAACEESLKRFEFLAQNGMIQSDDVRYLRDVIAQVRGGN